MRRQRLLGPGWGLLLPLLVFIGTVFLAPIGFMLLKSVYDPEVAELIPATSASLSHWTDETALPPTKSFDALTVDLVALVRDARVGELALRLNREQPGYRDLIEYTAERIHGKVRDLKNIDPQWSDPKIWQIIKRSSRILTSRYMLNAVDLQLDQNGSIERQSEQRRIYVRLFVRTIVVAAIVTVFCVMLGYPFAYILASTSGKSRAVLLFVVMLPFWTSLLVRTTAWIVLLQRRGVINELLVAANIISDGQRFALMYNFTGTIITMVYVLLPFFVLPLQSVMRSIPGQYVRAAESLGGSAIQVFRRIYLPMTMPGVAAGAALVFILALGYYVTPALVGGRTGQLISNQIAFHIQSSLNWGLAAALGSILLALVIAICLLLSRFVRQWRLQP